MKELPPRPGTYALILRPTMPGEVEIGALGTLRLEPGWYVYVGSALGPGGLAARVGRHADDAEKKPRHWHIDHLLPATDLAEVWYTVGPDRREEAWARHVRSRPGATVPLAGFGAGDCGCAGHLVHAPRRPRLDRLRSDTGAERIHRVAPGRHG